MQPESQAVVSDSLSKFPEPEKLDPPDRLTIPSVCRPEDEAQHVPPVQHSLEAEDLAEARCVHPVLDADQALAAEDEAQHIPPAQHSLKAGDLDEAQHTHLALDAGDQAVSSQGSGPGTSPWSPDRPDRPWPLHSSGSGPGTSPW